MKRKNVMVEVNQPVPTTQELDWVRELAKGASNNEAAEKFGYNPNTFAFHIAELRKRYNVPNTVALVVYFKDNEFI